jgi:hypothetical protein
MHRVPQLTFFRPDSQYIVATKTSNSTALLPDEEKFNCTGYSGFKTKILALTKARDLGGYLDGTIINAAPTPTPGASPTPTPLTTTLPAEPTNIYSLAPSPDKWMHHNMMARALLILNFKSPVDLGLKVDGTAWEAMQSLDDSHLRH